MDRPEELRTQLNTLREEIRTLTEAETLDETQEARFTAALDEFTALEARAVAAEQRAVRVAAALADATATVDGHDAPAQINRDDPFAGEIRTAPRVEARDRALRVLESHGKHLSARQLDGMEKLLRKHDTSTDGGVIARRLLLTENDAYRSAFMRGISTGPGAYLTPEEGAALNRFRHFEQEERAASEGTGGAGGYGVPVLIDPTIILTSGAAAAPILDISRVVTITTNQWKGVSSAGMSWAYQAEGATVADGTPVLAQPTIPVYAARGFIPYSLEIGEDYPGFQEEMSSLLAQGYLNLLAINTMTGSGVNQPTGIFTGMAAATVPPHIIPATLGQLNAVDVRKAWGALPERFRPNATYVMNVLTENVIRAWGNNLALADFTVNMLADGTSNLTGRPVVKSDYAPAFTGVTGAASLLVLGDFRHFVIVQRAGMTVELVPHLFDPATGRPTGQRGWFAFARHGFDADTYNAFRIVANT